LSPQIPKYLPLPPLYSTFTSHFRIHQLSRPRHQLALATSEVTNSHPPAFVRQEGAEHRQGNIRPSQFDRGHLKVQVRIREETTMSTIGMLH
jgi:hypothetical protein